MLNYTVKSTTSLLDTGTEFLPFPHSLKYSDNNFIAGNVHRLIPTGKSLMKFINDDEKADQPVMPLCIRVAKILFLCGFPENAKGYIGLKDGIPDEAYKHLVWMTSETTMDLITEGMDLKGSEKEGWWLTLFAFLLDQWIDRQDLYKLVYYSEGLFSPCKLVLCDNDDESWAFIKNKEIFVKCKDFGFVNFANYYKKAEKILSNFHFRGGNEQFYQALQFHSFLPPISTYALVTKWMMDKSKEGTHIAAVLMAFYMDNFALDNCIATVK